MDGLRDRVIVFAGGVLFCFLLAGVVFAYSWSSDGVFGSGEFNDTLLNSTGGYVYLNYSDWSVNDSYVANGTYTSGVLDFGSSAHFERLTWSGVGGSCPDGMAFIDRLGGFCIDKYGAVAWNASGWISSSNTSSWDAASTDAALSAGAYANSTAGYYPWVYVDRDEAQIACSNAGKHLCTSREWLAAANINGSVYYLPAGDSSNPIPAGATDGEACVTYEAADCDWSDSPNGGDACWGGSHSGCVSSEGVYDLVGNVWEWCNETVDTTDPGSGTDWYYSNSSSLDWSTDSNADDGKYGKDGCYIAGVQTDRAVLRGGHWNYEGAAGVFAVALHRNPGYTNGNFGFRCCAAPI